MDERKPEGEDEILRAYGAPEVEDKQGPGEEGMRGAATASLAEPHPDQRHTIDAADGRRLTVEEESGSAFVEDTVAPERRPRPPRFRRLAVKGASRDRIGGAALAATIAAAAGAALAWWWTRSWDRRG